MVEIAACGDEGLTKWCSLQAEDYTMDGSERGEIEVRLQWKHDRKYRRSLMGLMSGMGGLLMGSGKGESAPQATKTQPPKKTGIETTQNWMIEEEDVKLSAKEMDEFEEQLWRGNFLKDSPSGPVPNPNASKERLERMLTTAAETRQRYQRQLHQAGDIQDMDLTTQG